MSVSQKSPLSTTYFSICLRYFFSVFALYESEDVSVRISSYFIFGFCMIFPMTLKLVKIGYERYFVATIIVILSLYSIRNMIYSDQITTILYRPYQNYLLVEVDIQRSDAEERKDILLNNTKD